MTSKFIVDQKVKFQTEAFTLFAKVAEVTEIDAEENLIFIITEDGSEYIVPEVFGITEGLSYARQ